MDSTKETVNTFDKYARQYEEKYQNHGPYLETYEEFSKLLSDSHLTVLDIACGPGTFSSFLKKKNPELCITGIDLAPSMIALARKNIPDGEFIVLDSRAVDTLDRRFDVVLLGFCTPYLSREETSDLLLNVSTLLNDEGVLYLSSIDGSYEKSGYQSNAAKDRVYTYYHSLEYLSDLLTKNGFDIVHTQDIALAHDDGTESREIFVFARKSPR